VQIGRSVARLTDWKKKGTRRGQASSSRKGNLGAFSIAQGQGKKKKETRFPQSNQSRGRRGKKKGEEKRGAAVGDEMAAVEKDNMEEGRIILSP